MNTQNSATHRGKESGTPYRRHPKSGAIEFWDRTKSMWCKSVFEDADALNDTFTFERIETFDDWFDSFFESDSGGDEESMYRAAQAAWNHLTQQT